MEREPGPFELNLFKSLAGYIGRIANFLWAGARGYGDCVLGVNHYQEYTTPFTPLAPNPADKWDSYLLKKDIKTGDDLNRVFDRIGPPMKED